MYGSSHKAVLSKVNKSNINPVSVPSNHSILDKNPTEGSKQGQNGSKQGLKRLKRPILRLGFGTVMIQTCANRHLLMQLGILKNIIAHPQMRKCPRKWASNAKFSEFVRNQVMKTPTNQLLHLSGGVVFLYNERVL